jgi:hypothetical protein
LLRVRPSRSGEGVACPGNEGLVHKDDGKLHVSAWAGKYWCGCMKDRAACEGGAWRPGAAHLLPETVARELRAHAEGFL